MINELRCVRAARLAGLLALMFMSLGPGWALAQSAADSVPLVEQLTRPQQLVEARILRTSDGLRGRAESDRGGFVLESDGLRGTANVVFAPPAETDRWDFSAYSYFRVELTNAGEGLVWVQGRLDNPGAQDWQNSSASQVFIRPGESATLGIAYPRGGNLDDSPAIFSKMAAKPNGWRSHWKGFDATNVRQLVLRIQSSADKLRLHSVSLGVGYPFGAAVNSEQLALPFLDPFGQPIPFNWPGKLTTTEQLESAWVADATAVASAVPIEGWSEYGGWSAGPQLEATGYFRVQKFEGKWWLVDPSGRLFWSHGMNSVDYASVTPIKGRKALFAWLPEQGDALYDVTMTARNNELRVNFAGANAVRRFGSTWEEPGWDLIHRRFAAWGMNTLGAWSDGALADDRRTSYTAMVHSWHPDREKIGDVADPFAEKFGERLRNAIGKVCGEHREDPWCLGVFVDNEIHWPGDIIPGVFAAPADQPAKLAFVAFLRDRYETIAAFNQAWSTAYPDWNALQNAAGLGDAKVPGADWDALHRLYADRYYAECRAAMNEVMPNHLYLGSRVHHCPRVVAEAAAPHLDVFSVNHYWPLAGTGSMPGDIDKPVMVTEFHFGTIDRGVLGPSLYPVHGQTQRARAYAAYVASALIHDKVVGTHYFAYRDQSAVGRPGENYQIGFVDIVDLPYDEVISASRVIGESMYELRSSKDAQLLGWLQEKLPATATPR